MSGHLDGRPAAGASSMTPAAAAAAALYGWMHEPAFRRQLGFVAFVPVHGHFMRYTTITLPALMNENC